MAGNTGMDATDRKSPNVEDADLFLDAEQLKIGGVKLALTGALKLEVKDLEARLTLEANLEGVVGVLRRLVEALDDNPEVLQDLLQTVENVAEEATGAVVEGTDAGPLRAPAGGRGRTVRRVVDEEGEILETTLDRNGRVLEEEVLEATKTAERRAGELGVDLATVKGTGKDARILVRDVEKAAGERG